MVRTAAHSAEDVRVAEAFWQRYDPRRLQVGQPATVVSTEEQINTAMRAGLTGDGKIKSRVAVQSGGLFVAATADIPLPIGKSKRYANIRAVFAPSPSGLKISRLQIGRLRMPPNLSLPIFQAFVEVYAGTGRGAEVVDSIRAVRVDGKSVSVAFKPPASPTAPMDRSRPRTPAGRSPSESGLARRALSRQRSEYSFHFRI